jgi:hypothetical protein
MWYIVEVVKGSKYFETESRVGNRVLISDTTELVIVGRTMGAEGYRFEARKSGDNFVVKDIPGNPSAALVLEQFLMLARQFGALPAQGTAVPGAA